MPLPQFSQMLVARRTELGLDVYEAARVLRIKEDVLYAFEEGNFEEMPPPGYAQGMLGSYARYLGLNPTYVNSLYKEDLYYYEHGKSSAALRRSNRRMQRNEPELLLPSQQADTSADGRRRTRRLRDDDPSADFSVARAQPREGRALVRSVPGRTLGDNLSGDDEEKSNSRRYHSPYEVRSAPLVTPRPYHSGAGTVYTRSSSKAYARATTSASAPTGAAASARRTPAREERAFNYQSTISMQPISEAYIDDLHYNDLAAGPRVEEWAPPSTNRRRMQARTQVAREQETRQRRVGRPPQNRGGRGRNQVPQPRNGRGGRGGRGGSSAIQMRNIVITAGALVALLLVLVIIFGIRACSKPAEPETTNVPVSTVEPVSDASKKSNKSTNTNTDSTSTSTNTTTTPTYENGVAVQPQNPEVRVHVELAAGAVSWVEIVCDGVSEVATTVSGPQSFDYTVVDTLTISVNKPSAVTVTSNGKEVPFSSVVQGIGSITIHGPGPQANNPADPTGEGQQGGVVLNNQTEEQSTEE